MKKMALVLKGRVTSLEIVKTATRERSECTIEFTDGDGNSAGYVRAEIASAELRAPAEAEVIVGDE